ncbi:metal-dependent hydrolase [Candidatus Woesearchaeota archaeon]|nr:metal-dependent hydrolase [Candidatus Woesearchaeota archaeon]
MLTSSHLLFGLIIGKLLNHPFMVALGAVVIDIDHIYAYYMRSRSTSLRHLLHINLIPDDFLGLRSFFHTTIGWAITTALLMAVNYEFGFYFSIGYLSHLFLDAMDGSNLYLFYPLNINILGPITYNSYAEYLLNICFLVVLFII